MLWFYSRTRHSKSKRVKEHLPCYLLLIITFWACQTRFTPWYLHCHCNSQDRTQWSQYQHRGLMCDCNLALGTNTDYDYDYPLSLTFWRSRWVEGPSCCIPSLQQNLCSNHRIGSWRHDEILMLMHFLFGASSNSNLLWSVIVMWSLRGLGILQWIMKIEGWTSWFWYRWCNLFWLLKQGQGSLKLPLL